MSKISKYDLPGLRTDDPGTVQAAKADATYRNAPHTFRADPNPDGSVTLTVQQNYTGKRQWFGFGPGEWEKLAVPGLSGIFLTSAQLRAWAGLGRDLTRDELSRLEGCIPDSSVPDAIGTIVTEALGLTGSYEDDPAEDDRSGTAFGDWLDERPLDEPDTLRDLRERS